MDQINEGEREFPMQDGPPIPWKLAEEIYQIYSSLYGTDQTLERLAERGGFGWEEVAIIGKAYRRRNLSLPPWHKIQK